MQYEVSYTQMDQEISYMDIKWISEISLQLFCKFKITSKYKLKNKCEGFYIYIPYLHFDTDLSNN